MQKIDVQKYTNYLDFLRNYVSNKKQNPSWSLGLWKRQLNLKSTSTLTMLLKGQRHPGPKLTQKLSQYFKFDAKDKQYFESLIEIQKKVNDPNLALFILNSPEFLMHKSQIENTKVNRIDDLFYKRLSHIIREMCQLREFKSDAKWISQNLLEKIPIAVLEDLIEKMKNANLLKESLEGNLQPMPMQAVANPKSKELIAQFHQEVISGSLTALRLSPENERSFHVTFLNVRADKVSEAREKIMQFQNEFSELFEETPGDAVYQLSIQFTPTTEIHRDGSKGTV
jgi:uncharacterized protein (TIGR02147 family)